VQGLKGRSGGEWIDRYQIALAGVLLIDFGFLDPALSNAAGTAKWTEGDAFSGVQSNDERGRPEFYWSSTAHNELGFAWAVSLHDGATSAGNELSFLVVWPVRGEQNRSFGALRLWTLWGVQGGSPHRRQDKEWLS
jgi:hypothetical protein